jgi:hypothetical protein
MKAPQEPQAKTPHDLISNAMEAERQTAVYISDMALELRDLAHLSNLPFIAYLLEMVLVEAHTIAYKAPPNPYLLGRRRKRDT